MRTMWLNYANGGIAFLLESTRLAAAFAKPGSLGIMRRALSISTLVLALVLPIVGCSPSAKGRPDLIERVRKEVAKSLKKDVAQIDVRKPLGAQGADELDIVEIVMAVEEAFKVEIPDSAVGKKPAEIAVVPQFQTEALPRLRRR